MASTPVHKPLQSIDGNAMTPTQWLQTAKYVQYTSPAPLTPYKTAAHSTPDSHTRRVDALQANIDRSMVALMAPHPQRTPPPPPAPPPPPPSAIRAVLPPAVDSSSDDDVPLAAMMLERDAERAAEKEDVKSVEDIKSVSAPVPADPVPPTLSGASDAPPLTLALRLKHKYNKAKEVLELGAHGGMKMVGRHAHGAASETHSGHRWSFLCCYHKTNKCPASGTIASDFSVHVEAGHLIPDKNTAGAFIAGTGCERYGKFRGLHQSEMEIVQQHDVTAPSATNAKAVSNKIAAKQLADRRAAAVTHQEGNEDTFVKHTPSARSIRHTVNKAKAHCDVDLSSIGDIQTLVEKYWSEKTKHIPFRAK